MPIEESQRSVMSQSNSQETAASTVNGFSASTSSTSDSCMPREAVLQLIQIYRSMESKFKTSVKKRNLWENIALDLESNGFKKYTWIQIKNKWNNLLLNYRKTVDHNNSTGNEPKRCPFYEELNEFLSCRPNISPENLVASFTAPETPTDSLPSPSSSITDTPTTSTDTPTISAGNTGIKGPKKKRQRLTPRTEKIIDILTSHESSRKEDVDKLLKEMHDEHEEFMKLEKSKLEIEKEKNDIFRKLLDKL
ncbi:hypothetical protein SNE40_003441 [Patella caerulea]|uniref:Myb/SANT-like DNA-binding domain-containing protein n=1 Tax=Patella caerulea TaxID=87958 RepID=A0AAN8K7Y4_PATCE